MRHPLAIAFALAVTALPPSAFACGMYIPPEKERMLTEIMDDIDAPTPVTDEAAVAASAANVQQDVADQTAVADQHDADAIPEIEPTPGI